jgi:uncharacterized MAPEG superfamily protein
MTTAETGQPVSAGQSVDVRSDQSALKIAGLIAFPTTVAVWLAVYSLTPALSGMSDPVARLFFTMNCCCIAVLFCFVTAIEAISHERLHSAAIDPLSGAESHRMRVNHRYLQQTLEQLLLFVPGLLSLALYCNSGSAMRAVVASTVVWIVSRAVYWIAYHQGSQYRSAGLTGMVQSILILLYVSARFDYDIAGIAGAAAPLILYGAIEIYLVNVTRRPERER